MKALKATEFYEGEIRDVPITDFYDYPKTADGVSPRTTIPVSLNVYPEEKQEIFGFGGAFTESAAYNYAQMSPKEKAKTIEWLFGKSGLHYNFCRLTIGSCDFSCGEYSYVKEADTALKTFSIERDKKYVIPFVKDALKASEEGIFLFASAWSPPAFIKTSNCLTHGGKLKTEFYPVYADYLAKFVEEYAKEGIYVSALTIQNEPNAVQTWESCIFTAEEEAAFAPFLYAALQRRNLNVKILCFDHNKGDVYDHARVIYPKQSEKVWGMGFHWYDGGHFEECSLLRELYPEKR